MILLVDVGNTNIIIGIHDEYKLIADFSLATDSNKTSDEMSIQLIELFKMNNVKISEITGVIISSVVPNIMHSFENTIINTFHIYPMVVSQGLKTGIIIKTENPMEVGSDRIVNAVAAYVKHKRSIILVGFRTVTTIDAITATGSYIGGAIIPGIKISADALFEKGAKLPRIELVKPEKVIGKNTVTSMQSGIVLGYIGSIEYIIGMMKKEMMMEGGSEPIVIATGGLSRMIHSFTNTIDFLEPGLALEGLKIIYDKNRKEDS